MCVYSLFRLDLNRNMRCVRVYSCSTHFNPVNASLQLALRQWATQFPREGADFNIIAPSPQLVGH
eukprot:COSAG02_NODE_49085_length_329_cov_0.769565_1_plen_64_part_01